MPIQPLNVGRYNQIPDVEDVTPTQGSLAKRERRVYRFIAVALGFLVLLAVLYFGFGVKPPVSFSFPTPWPSLFPGTKTVTVYQTAKDEGGGLKPLSTREMQDRGFKVGNELAFGNVKYAADQLTSPAAPSQFFVDTKQTFQEIIGFGGAFTEAAAVNFFKLPAHVQKRVIELYYGATGIGYSVGRVHINSCDFSLKSYSFDNIAGDYALQYFDTEVRVSGLYSVVLGRPHLMFTPVCTSFSWRAAHRSRTTTCRCCR